MPSGYAHYRFGKQVLPLMPADVRGPILRHKALFDVGLHGPDFLFFHHFFKKTPLFRLGSAYHQKSGQAFFEDACAHLKQQPSEEGLAYLYGLLTHYCLDSQCHPFVYEMTDDTDLDHSELETEFDRYLLSLDGVKRPREVNISRSLRLQNADAAVVAGFYPEITARDVASCFRSMALSQQLLTIPTVVGYTAVTTFTKFAGGNTSGKAMTLGPNPKCAHLDRKLLELYEQALARFPQFLEQLSRHMAYGEPFAGDFKANFDRG